MTTRFRQWASCAAAGAAGLVLLTACAASSGPGRSLDGVAGTHWRLDRFTAPGSAAAVMVTTDSWLALDSPSTVLLYDTCHWLSGPAQKAGDGFRISETRVTANACIGMDAARAGVMAAVGAVSGGATVSALHTPTSLQLTVDGYVLSYLADGPYPSMAAS
jgi:hypothetical protein